MIVLDTDHVTDLKYPESSAYGALDRSEDGFSATGISQCRW